MECVPWCLGSTPVDPALLQHHWESDFSTPRRRRRCNGKERQRREWGDGGRRRVFDGSEGIAHPEPREVLRRSSRLLGTGSGSALTRGGWMKIYRSRHSRAAPYFTVTGVPWRR